LTNSLIVALEASDLMITSSRSMVTRLPLSSTASMAETFRFKDAYISFQAGEGLFSPSAILFLIVMRYHVRRKDKEITDGAALRRLLGETEYVTLAMSKDNQPYLVSLSIGYDGERNCVYFHCAREGKKLDYLRANDAVWGQALRDYGYKQEECSHVYATVQFYGRVRFLEGKEEKLHAFRVMARQLDDDPEARTSGIKLDSLDNTIVGRIDIEHMTGKKSEEVEL
jgi:nitroimidazol reductase NimA-like FMN-containing flavoprotein (pyridoxamine 5'-phosphate oxidase superfamily)